MPAIDFVYMGICNFAYLVRSSHSLRKKIKISLTYFKIAFKFFTIAKIFHLNKEKIVGHRIVAFDYETIYYLFDEIFFRNEYMFHANKKDPVVIDCGANIGLATIFFKWVYPKSVIYSFEPDQDTFKLLNNNISANKLNGVSLFNSAVGDSDGKINFYVDTKKAGSLKMSTRRRNLSDDKVTVDSISLASFIVKHNIREIDFLKMDIEGSEYQVMMDLERNGIFQKINKIVVEYHHKINDEKSSFGKFLDIFERNGFEYQINARCIPASAENKYQDFLVYLYKTEQMSADKSVISC
jgi:FkbM family methyltransferase